MPSPSSFRTSAPVLLAVAALAIAGCPSSPEGPAKISSTAGGFSGILDNHDVFGAALASPGDLDENGTRDLAVGAPFDDDGGPDSGAVWLLYLDDDGSVERHNKLSTAAGTFNGAVETGDFFGMSVASLGDLDGNGSEDLAVGAIEDDDGGPGRGAVWILFLGPDGRALRHQKISDTQGGFGGGLADEDSFGLSLASLGDMDGDGVGDLAVGSIQDDDGGVDRGAVWILFLNRDGSVKSHAKISDTQGGFSGELGDDDYFGASLATLGDLDGDTVPELAVGASFDDDGGVDRGAVWLLFLTRQGSVKAHRKISSSGAGWEADLSDGALFGAAVSAPGDLDGDGVADLAVGASFDDDGGKDRGSLWILFLKADGGVARHQKISDTQGDFQGLIDDSDYFGISVAPLGAGSRSLAVGASFDDDGGINQGAVWILSVGPDGRVVER